MMKKFIYFFSISLILVILFTTSIYTAKNINIKKNENLISSEFEKIFSYKAEYYTGSGENSKNGELKLLVLGNSISSGVIVDNIKDDYVNILIRKISAKQNNRPVRARVYNISNFERHYQNYNYDVLKPLLEYDPDIVIFQLGDNYLKENDELYFQRFVTLIKTFDNANIKIVTSPYWGQRRKNKLNENAALATNSFYVDLSNLFVYDKKTRADYKKHFENKALGEHPGEYGMKRIAEEIFVLINACIYKKLI